MARSSGCCASGQGGGPPNRGVFEDRELEITSILGIDVPHQIAAVHSPMNELPVNA